jgi:hypothetical protein
MMSQDYTSRKRRTARARNRPVLVTSANVEQSEADVKEKGAATEALSPAEKSTALSTAPAASAPSSVVQRIRRLPGFFSTIGKSEREPDVKEADVAQARLARATRGKVAAQSSQPAAEDEKPTETKATRPTAPSKASSAPARPASPPSPFKTRYILGMGIYLLGANFIGVFEQQLLRSYNMDVLLTQFNLFGGIIRVSTSTVTFLATLVVLLVILAKFDLIPRNLSAMSGTPAQRSGQSQRGTGGGERDRSSQPAMRQGVKGADDELYREYRANQRREKKR